MRFHRRRPTDADLMSWLQTGKPERIDKVIDDPDVTGRLERLTALPSETVERLEEAVAPDEGFRDRAEASLQDRVSDLERAGALFGLLGLGVQTIRTLAIEDEAAPDDGASTER